MDGQMRQNKYFVPLLGCCFEYFDFMLYIHMAPIITQKFFPANNPELVRNVVIAVGFASRPIGGLVFSHFSDKFNRLKVLQVSAFMMGVCSLFLAFLPTYASIGYIATFSVIFLRIMQGLSAGGEIPSAVAYLIEQTKDKYKGLMAGVVFFAFTIGSVFAFAASSYVIIHINNSFVNEFGWRIPFIIGGVLFILSFYMRIQIRKSDTYKSTQPTLKYPAVYLFKKYKFNIFNGVVMFSLITLILVSFFSNMAALAHNRLGISKTTMSYINTVFYIVLPTLAILVGWISSKVKELKLYFIGVFLLFLFSIFFIFFFKVNGVFSVIFMYSLVTISASFLCGTFYTIAYNMFPREVRASGIALVSGLATMIVGGFGPILIYNLINRFYGVNAVFVLILLYILLFSSFLFYQFFVKNLRKNYVLSK